MSDLRVFTCTEFTGHYPVGTSAVVFARGPRTAARMLNKKLQEIGLPGGVTFDKMKLQVHNEPHAIILQDGNY